MFEHLSPWTQEALAFLTELGTLKKSVFTYTSEVAEQYGIRPRNARDLLTKSYRHPIVRSLKYSGSFDSFNCMQRARPIFAFPMSPRQYV